MNKCRFCANDIWLDNVVRFWYLTMIPDVRTFGCSKSDNFSRTHEPRMYVEVNPWLK